MGAPSKLMPIYWCLKVTEIYAKNFLILMIILNRGFIFLLLLEKNKNIDKSRSIKSGEKDNIIINCVTKVGVELA